MLLLSHINILWLLFCNFTLRFSPQILYRVEVGIVTRLFQNLKLAFCKRIRHNFQLVARGTVLHKHCAFVNMCWHFQLIRQQFNVLRIVNCFSKRRIWSPAMPFSQIVFQIICFEGCCIEKIVQFSSQPFSDDLQTYLFLTTNC